MLVAKEILGLETLLNKILPSPGFLSAKICFFGEFGDFTFYTEFYLLDGSEKFSKGMKSICLTGLADIKISKFQNVPLCFSNSYTIVAVVLY